MTRPKNNKVNSAIRSFAQQQINKNKYKIKNKRVNGKCVKTEKYTYVRNGHR